MKLKHSVSLLSLAVCAVVSTSALAQSSGTLDVKGFISPVSCTPQLTGGAIAGNTLTLPDAFITDLDAAGKFSGETAFSFELSGCTTATGINNMWVHFSGSNVDGNGRLQPTTGTNNIRFELLNGSSGTVIKAGGSVPTGAPNSPGADQGTVAAFIGTNPNRSVSKTYAVRYYANQALTLSDVGAVASSVTYNVQYN